MSVELIKELNLITIKTRLNVSKERAELIQELGSDPERASLESKHGQVWDTQELQQDFIVKSFLAPFILVKRKSDGVEGTLMFQHSPRYYFAFDPA